VFKALEEFQVRHSPSTGRPRTSRRCRVCDGLLGRKVCVTCGLDKPVSFFIPRTRAQTVRSECAPCRSLKRTRPTTRSERAAKARSTAEGIAKSRRQKALHSVTTTGRPIGWTPPPTLDELARWHGNLVATAKPLPGWSSCSDRNRGL
jgi:hypothetical protein